MARVNPIPQGMHTLTPNLVLRDCAKAIAFYQQALGAKEVSRFMAPDGKSVWHAELQVGDSKVFVNDEMPGMGATAPSPDRPVPVTMWLYVPDCDAAYRQATAAGATGTSEPSDMFWGDRCAGIVDPYGYMWTFATRQKELTRDEMKRAGEEFARRMAPPHQPPSER
jgi:uncharacterized glyoxalase superfamily protein PhnB